MKRTDDGYALLGALALLLLLAGFTALLLGANVRLLRDNQQRATTLQQRANQLHLATTEN